MGLGGWEACPSSVSGNDTFSNLQAPNWGHLLWAGSWGRILWVWSSELSGVAMFELCFLWALTVLYDFHFHQTLLCMGGYSKWFSGVKCVHGFWHHSMANHWLTWGLFLFSCRVSRNTACFLTSWPKATLDRVESEITCLTNQKSLAQAHFCCLCLI